MGNKRLLVCTLVIDLDKVVVLEGTDVEATAIETVSEAIQFSLPGAVQGRVNVHSTLLTGQQRYEDAVRDVVTYLTSLT